MKVQRDWQDEQELFEAVVNALELKLGEDEGIDNVIARDEQGSYGERGYIHIEYQGRTFSLELHEIRY